MDAAAYAVTFRIVWCRRQRANASTQMELEAWRAEEEGLRDAVLHRDHVHKYRSHSPKVLERYLLGFQDAKALIRTARVARICHAARNRTQCRSGSDRIAIDRTLPDSADHLTYESSVSG